MNSSHFGSSIMATYAIHAGTPNHFVYYLDCAYHGKDLFAVFEEASRKNKNAHVDPGSKANILSIVVKTINTLTIDDESTYHLFF